MTPETNEPADARAAEALFQHYRDRLRAMVRLRPSNIVAVYGVSKQKGLRYHVRQ